MGDVSNNYSTFLASSQLTTAFTDPAIVLSMFMLSFIFVIVCGLVEASLYCQWKSSYQEEKVGIPLIHLTPPHFCACSKSGPGFPMSYVMVILCLES